MKFKLLKINTLGNISELSISNTDKAFTNLLKQEPNVHLLYWWKINSYVYQVYGNLECDSTTEKNNHILPPNGTSDIIDIDSESILVYGSMFLIKTCSQEKIDLTMDDYGEFYNLMTLQNEDIDLSENEYSEELEQETVKCDLKKMNTKEDYTEELKMDENEY